MAIQVEDIGTDINLTINDQDDAAVNLTSATVKKIILSSPSGVIVEEDTTDVDLAAGQVKYTLQANDIDAAGTWQVQMKFTNPSGTWKTEKKSFEVESNLN